MSRKPRTDSSMEGELYEDGPVTPEGLLARKQNAHSMNPFGMGMVSLLGVLIQRSYLSYVR